MLNNGRNALFCICLVVAIKYSAGFWPFNRNTQTTPTLQIIPETEHNFIYFKYSKATDTQPYIDAINRFLNDYDRANRVENARFCDFNNPNTENGVCVFDKNNLNVCSGGNFGYNKASPCIYFTLSQLQNWIPIVLNGSDTQPHSDPFLNIPDHLNSTIAESENSSYIWLTCEGDTSADKEFIGPLSYYPTKGFPTFYFPFKNVEGYQSPIVAVHFTRPTRGVVITIECKAWAKNINIDRENGIGYVKFHLLID